MKTTSVKEPLDELGLLGFEQAGKTCEPSHGCASFHKMYSLIRLLISDGALPGGADEVAQELRRLNLGPDNRVLVSGAADTGLLSVILQPYEDPAGAPQIVVADLCRTPLLQNSVFAKKLGYEIETRQGDLLKFQSEPFDAIFAHSFLNYFSDEGQADLIKVWARHLTPNGSLILVNNLSENETPIPRNTGGRLDAKLGDLVAAAEKVGLTGQLGKTLEDDAREFWSRPPTNPTTRPRLVSMLEDSGLGIDQEIPLVGQTGTGPLALTSTPAGRVRTVLICRHIK